MWGSHHNYPLKFVPYVQLSFLIFVPSELMRVQNTKNLILMNYKIIKKKKNQSHILNKNHHTIKITTCSILLKIRRKKIITISIKFR